MNQKKYHMKRKRKWRISLLVLIALLLVATLLWIMNIENIILGSWSNAINAIFTALSVVIAIIQLHMQYVSEDLVSAKEQPSQKKHEQYYDDISLGVNKRRGAVIVYTNRKLRGKPTSLVSSSQRGDVHTCMNSNIVERSEGSRKVFSSIFPSVQSGQYIVSIQSQNLSADITVYAGYISEIDWR